MLAGRLRCIPLCCIALCYDATYCSVLLCIAKSGKDSNPYCKNFQQIFRRRLFAECVCFCTREPYLRIANGESMSRGADNQVFVICGIDNGDMDVKESAIEVAV